jgi:hypothetical protein
LERVRKTAKALGSRRGRLRGNSGDLETFVYDPLGNPLHIVDPRAMDAEAETQTARV